jgi:hypothetical protein
VASQLNFLDPRRPGTLGNPNLGGQGAAELQRLRMEMDQLLRSNLMTGLEEVREQLTNNIKIQSQLARACADLEEWRRWVRLRGPGAAMVQAAAAGSGGAQPLALPPPAARRAPGCSCTGLGAALRRLEAARCHWL